MRKGKLKKLIKNKEIEVEIHQRLVFINLILYKKKNVAEACYLLDISEPTGYQWLERWNEEGYAGLIPKYAGGRPSRLSSEQKAELDSILENKMYLTTKIAYNIIKEKFNVEFSLNRVRAILIELGYHYTKPYQFYSKRPDDSEEILKKNF